MSERSSDDDAATSGEHRFETRAIHAGQEPDAPYGAVNVPIYQTSTYAQPEVGSPKVWDYARGGNPTREALQQALASLEGGARAFSFASGLGAETTLLLTLRPGDHVVLADDVYGGHLPAAVEGARRVGSHVLDRRPRRSRGAAAERMTGSTELVWIETPSNPLLKIVDIEAVSALAHEHGARVVVDNTFATPALQRPLGLGADAVVHSVTKYIGGHSDLIGGAIVTSDEEWIERLGFLVNAVGRGARVRWTATSRSGGLKTLAVRMRAHCAGARAIAGLPRDPSGRVTQVHYPGLEEPPGP